MIILIPITDELNYYGMITNNIHETPTILILNFQQFLTLVKHLINSYGGGKTWNSAQKDET